MLCILKAFGGYVLLFLLCINLLGQVVRGFYEHGIDIGEPVSARAMMVLQNENRKIKIANVVWTILFACLLGGLLYALNRYWNAYLVAAAVMILVGRMPDLLWEIHHGKTGPKGQGVVYVVGFVLILSALPVVWYALCRVPSGQ
jgi:hypothetical protein